MHAVTNIQKFSIHDGDGIRTTVFFKGCHLRCAWCHNPETQRFTIEMQTDTDKCTGCGRCVERCPNGAISLQRIERPRGAGKQGTETVPVAVTDRSKCTVCGKCVNACVGNYRTVVGKEYPVKELVKICLQDQMFYEDSGGGVTLSGGEVMAIDNDYLLTLVKMLDREGVDVTIDTCGEAPWENFQAILPYVHTWLYDVKVMDNDLHRQYMGLGNERILENLVRLSDSGARIYIRIPTIPEVNGTPEAMGEIIAFLKENHIDPPQINLLPYHKTGSHKYRKLGRPYPGEDLTVPTNEQMEAFVRQFNEAGYRNVRIGG